LLIWNAADIGSPSRKIGDLTHVLYEELCNTLRLGSELTQVERPLVYFYGAASPADNPELYRSYVERLAALLEEQAAASLEVSLLQQYILM